MGMLKAVDETLVILTGRNLRAVSAIAGRKGKAAAGKPSPRNFTKFLRSMALSGMSSFFRRAVYRAAAPAFSLPTDRNIIAEV
jgi:hypothetical protein